MLTLDFVVPPVPTSRRRIGNEYSGILEVEVKGGLTTDESDTISDLLSEEQSSFVQAAKLADAIATSESISQLEAFTIIEKAISGLDLEPDADAIRLRHAEAIAEIAKLYRLSATRNVEASITAIIRHRLDRPQWGLSDTRALHKALRSGIWQLVLDEQAAEDMPSAPLSEEELGKPPAADGSATKRTGRRSSTT